LRREGEGGEIGSLQKTGFTPGSSGLCRASQLKKTFSLLNDKGDLDRKTKKMKGHFRRKKKGG